MEVVAQTPNGNVPPPFHNHDVREWSRIDNLTGVLERARFETDHWTANTNSSSHKYGKVVDSRARSNADGAVQQRARRQLEVFESSVPGGRLQVIKSHTVSSSRWTSKTTAVGEDDFTQHFGDLNLSLNPLDLSSQKSKATVGRSVGRRPPSRPRARDEHSINQVIPATENVRLHRVSRLCNQIHETSVQPFEKYTNKPSIHDRECGDGTEINENNEKTNLTRTKSTSNDDVHLLTPEDKIKSVEDLEDLKQLQTWRRTSKLRRSLQLPKARTNSSKIDDLPQNTGSVRKIREDLETGRRLSTALRGNNVDLEALDHILQSISGKSDSDRSSISSEPNEISFKKQKRNSFVTVESLQEVKGRLRRTSSPTQDIYKVEKDADAEEADDGIVTEINNMSSGDGLVTPTHVRSYMFGMDKKSMVGTGSLESKSKQSNGTLSYRNEDWYNRRKSYGFEQVHNHQETMTPKSKNKDLIESSTDSGICRSGEIVELPVSNKNGVHNGFNSICDNYEDKLFNVGNVKRYTSIFEKKNPPLQNGKGLDYGYFEPKEPRNGFVQNLYEENKIITNGETKRHSIAVDESKYVTKTPNNNYRRISLAVNDRTSNDLTQDASEDDFLTLNKKQKKVEFCKTEVHFAAESGRVNIVTTDEKPPPTNNFRRRRRNSATLYDQLLADANTNGLPVLHFGDSSYEKNLLGFNEQENLEPEPEINTNTVTVSTNNLYQNYEENEDVQKEESEAPKGILKNKLIKPKPYLLGDDNFFTKPTNDDNQIWGVKLKPVPKNETLMWKSTVTLKNTLFEKQKNKNVFLQNPITNEQELNVVTNGCEKIQIVTPRSLGSVNKFEENNKGFSTKINIGIGDATVVSDNDLPNGTKNGIWPRYSEQFKDAKKNILNKALVVRIGRDEISSHTICSKTTTTQNDPSNNTTTTKITIDLSPSPTQIKEPTFNFLQVPPFKSTSLVLNTLNCENELPKKEVPEKLEVLRKLYEDWQSDSEADREVQLLMNKSEEERVKQVEQDNHSVVSGSWSKMRAFRHIKKSDELLQASIAKLQARAQVAKDFSNLHVQDEFSNKSTFEDKLEKPKLICRVPYSPVALRRPHQTKHEELRTAQKSEKLSSPFLVVQNVSDFENNGRTRNEEISLPRVKKEETRVASNFVRLKEKRPLTPIQMNFREKSSPISERRSNSHYSCMKQTQINGKLAENRVSPNRAVLRNPSQSEMAYFGITPTKQTNKKIEEKTHKKIKPINGYITKKTDSPIYENINEYNKSKNQKEFDSSILDELTKAADQILQAVNGYAEESLKQELEDEKNNQKQEKLDTICETKSWKQQNGTRHKSTVVTTKLKNTSSTSSIESIADMKKMHSNQRGASDSEKNKKKVNGEVTSLKAATKARRLQRASSREALLQSHGSSSEDLPVAMEVPVRKPRLVRKTKTASNGVEMSKSVNYSKRREGVTVSALPEIRHKTAVSTIRSTAEKTLNRERLQKMKVEEAKRKSKIESNKVTVMPKVRNVSNKEAINHRISTANIKKCNRYERSTTSKP